MAVESNNGGLYWRARIDTSEIANDRKRLMSEFGKIAKDQIEQDKKLLKGLSDNYKKVYADGRRAFNNMAPETQKQISTLTRYNIELRKVADAQRLIDQEYRKGNISASQYRQTTEGLTARTRNLNGELTKYQKNIAGSTKNSRLFNQVLATTAGIFSITQGTRLIGDIIRTRGEIEQLEVAFTTMLRSKQAADDLMKDIVQIATTTPFKLTEVASATKQLLAYGFAQSEIKQELLAIGNIASGVGSSFGEVAYAYGTLRSQGRAYMRDIRQFTTRGIPIIEELAKVLNTSTDNVQKLVEAGKVGFPEVQKAFQNLTGVGGQFFNLMEKQSQTVTGEIAKLQDRIQLMFNDIGKGNEGLIKGGISGLSFLVENYEEVIKIIELLIITYGSYRAALAITTALEAASAAAGVKAISLKALLTLATNKLAAAQRLLNVAMAANPYVAVASVLAGLISSFVLFSNKIEEAEQVQERLNRVGVETTKVVGDQEAKIKTLISTLSNQNIAESVRLKAYNDLKDISPDIVKGLGFEEAKTEDLTKAVYGYIDALEKRLRVENLTNEAVKLRGEIFEKEQQLIKSQDFQKYLKETGGDVLQVGARSSRYQDEVDRGNEIAKELENLYNQEIKIGDQINENLDNSEESTKKRIELLERLKKSVDETSVAYKTYEDQINALQKTIVVTETTPIQNKAFFEKIVEENTEALEMLDKSADDFETKSKAYKEKIIEAQKNLDAFGLKGEKSELKKEEKDQKDALKEREKILNQLNALEDKAYKKSFSKREQEKADLKRQLDELRQLAKDAGFGAGVLTRIDNLELNATGNIDYRNDTEKLKEEFEKRKKLYEDYEAHVRDFGVSSAEKRFKAELDIARNYLGDIQSEYNNLLAISATQTISGGSLTGPQSERLKVVKDILDAEKREQQSQFDALLKANQSFEQQRTALLENQAIERKKIQATGDFESLATFEKNAQKEIDALNEIAAKELTGFTEFFDNIRLMSRKAAYQGIDVLKKAINDLMKQGLLKPETGALFLSQLDEAAHSIGSEIPQEMQKWASAMNSIAQSVGEVNSGLGAMLGNLANMVGELANVQLGFNDLQAAQQTESKADDFSSKAGLYATAINSVVKLTGMVINASKQRREIDEKYYKSVLGYQQDYNLALAEQIRTQSEMSDSVFMTDYQGRLEDGYASLSEASKGFSEALKELEKVQVKTGTESFFDLKTAAGSVGVGAVGGAAIGALAAAAAGAAIGSVVPVLGTVIGAGVGAIVGIFAAKKKKNSYGALLEEFPELIQTSADGLVTVNKELAEAILANDLIRDGGKELVENVLEWGNAVEAAREQIKGTIGELTGQIGGELQNALVDAFRNGTDAGVAMADTVGKAIENMVSQLLFSAVFSDLFKALEDDLVKSLDPISGDQSVIDDFDRFLDKAGPAQETFFDLMDQIQKQAAGRGIDIFKPDSSGSGSTQQTGLAGAIRRELTEATGSELAGLMRGQYDLQKIQNNVSYEHLAVANSQLSATMAIQTNTAQTVTELRLAVVELRVIAKNTKAGQSDRGLGVD